MSFSAISISKARSTRRIAERGQDGRNGMFFVVENNDPFNTVTGLLATAKW
jgi:hypothetical protein